MQTDPLFKKLPNSKLIVRVEPMLDYSEVNKFEDLFHNHVEVRIDNSVFDYYLRTTTEDEIYGERFLLRHDKLITYVFKDK